MIPCRGSVGASGDLAPLAHLALVLDRRRRSLQRHRTIISGREALEAIGVTAARPSGQRRSRPSERNAGDARHRYHLLATAPSSCVESGRSGGRDVAGGIERHRRQLSTDASIRRGRIRGQLRVAERLSRFLQDSEIRQSHIDCGRVQDAYSLRCMPQVHGPVRECMEYVRNVIAIESNSATDNPLVFADSGDVLSGGNFHGQSLGLAFDFMSIVALGTCQHFRTAHRTVAQSGVWRSAAISGRRSRPEFRIHDRAGCRGSARERNESARRIRHPSTRFRLRAIKKITCRWLWERL